MMALSIIGTVASGIATIAGGAMQAQAIMEQGEAQHQAAVLQAESQTKSAYLQAYAEKEAADAQNKALRYQAEQLQIRAKEEEAASQWEAQQMRRERGLVQSALQARSAASGFTASDPTVLQIGSEIEKYGTLQEMMASFGGRSRRAGLEAEAIGRQAEGASILRGAEFADAAAANTAKYAPEIARYAGAGAKASAAASILGGIAGGFSRFASISLPPSGSSYRYG
jgi:hypothetical protein